MSNLQLHLPAIVKLVQCPLSWLEDPETLRDVPVHLLRSSESETLKSYIEFILHNGWKDPLGDDDMGEFAEDDNDVYVTFGSLAQSDSSQSVSTESGFQFLPFSQCIPPKAKRKYEEAQMWLEKAKILKDGFNQVEGVKQGQKVALYYCIEALEWSIKELQEKPKEVEVDEENSEVEEFQRRWEDLMENEREAEAVVAYFKARLAEVLMLPLDKILEKMEGVVHIDPDYFEWYQAVYHLLRGIRRGMRRNLNTWQLQRPCEKESLACRRAYELAPENFQCISNVALLIKEGLWTMEVAEWDQEEDDVLLCVKLFREALKLAEEKKLKRYICRTKVYLAEVILFGRGSQLLPLQDEGKSLLNDCEALYPQSSLVLHKLAKLYHFGAARSLKFKNQRLAKTYYKRSLKGSFQNFACLMDFLKLVKSEASRPNKSLLEIQKLYREILKEFKKCREVIQVDHQLVKLCALEGCIIWIFNPWGKSEDDRNMNACRVWLEVFKKWPHCVDSLVRTIENPPFILGWNRPASVPIPILIHTLNTLKVNEQPEEKVASFISAFVEGLSGIQRENSNAIE